MSISPLSPDEIRAAAEVHAELGPEYRDAVVESFGRRRQARETNRAAGIGRSAPG